MILITGGLGFIGLHTARHLIDLGEDVVLTQYRVAREPDFIKPDIGKHALVEQLDVTNADQLMEIGKKHKITGIAHLAVPALAALTPAQDYNVNMQGLINVLEAGREWGVKRVGLASSIAVYSGEDQGPFTEDMKLRMFSGANATETWKKTYEIVGSYYAGRTGMEVVSLRIAGIYGPLYHSMSNLPSRFVHAAVKGTAPEMRGETLEDDANDMTYVKDCGKGIAMLMHAPDKLPHSVYNVASGVATTNKQLADAVRKVVPDANLPLKPGGGARKNAYLDITRIKQDVGYEPDFTIESAVADYAAWLRAGNAE